MPVKISVLQVKLSLHELMTYKSYFIIWTTVTFNFVLYDWLTRFLNVTDDRPHIETIVNNGKPSSDILAGYYRFFKSERNRIQKRVASTANWNEWWWAVSWRMNSS